MILRTSLIIVLFVQFCFAEIWHDAFEAGNRYFRNNEFQSAIEAYSEALNNGMESGELYFNMGNAYYKINEVGKARLYYEKAARFLKNDEALQYNLDLVKMRLVDQIETPPQFILMEWWDTVLYWFPLNMLTWLALAVFILFLISLAGVFYFRSRSRHVSFIYIHRILLISLILFSIILLNRIYIFETEEFAVILKPKVTVYASPDKNGTEVFILHEGTKVKLLRGDADWFEMKLEDGKSGWLENSQIEKI